MDERSGPAGGADMRSRLARHHLAFGAFAIGGAAALLVAPRERVSNETDVRTGASLFPSRALPRMPVSSVDHAESSVESGTRTERCVASAGGTPIAPTIRPASSPGNWVTSDDYPGAELRLNHQGRTGFRLLVSAEGRATSCLVTQSSGHAGLDRAACDALLPRARFEPARDGRGCAIPGSYTSAVVWQIPEP